MKVRIRGRLYPGSQGKTLVFVKQRKVDAYDWLAGASGSCHVDIADCSGPVAVPPLPAACVTAPHKRAGSHRQGQRPL